MQADLQGAPSPAIACFLCNLGEELWDACNFGEIPISLILMSPLLLPKGKVSVQRINVQQYIECGGCSVSLCLGLPGSQLLFWALFVYMS